MPRAVIIECTATDIGLCVLIEDRAEVIELFVDLTRGRTHDLGITRDERGEVVQVMDEQLGRLEAGAHGANVDDALLGGFENLEEVGDRAAVAFDETDRVVCLSRDALGHIGNQGLVELVHSGERCSRMASSDTQVEVVGKCCGGGRGRCDGHEAGCGNAHQVFTCCHGLFSQLNNSGRPSSRPLS